MRTKALRRSTGGFSLLELVMVMAIFGTLTAIAVPLMADFAESQRLSTATREVERELQSARLKAVSTNQRLWVRTNCPAVGQLRTTEFLGTFQDTVANRCDPAAFPFPAPDNDLTTVPNNDGPVRILSANTTVTTEVVEFRPDGTAREVVAGVPQPIAGTLNIVVTRFANSRTVTVNALGKVAIQ